MDRHRAAYQPQRLCPATNPLMQDPPRGITPTQGAQVWARSLGVAMICPFVLGAGMVAALHHKNTLLWFFQGRVAFENMVLGAVWFGIAFLPLFVVAGFVSAALLSNNKGLSAVAGRWASLDLRWTLLIFAICWCVGVALCIRYESGPYV